MERLALPFVTLGMRDSDGRQEGIPAMTVIGEAAEIQALWPHVPQSNRRGKHYCTWPQKKWNSLALYIQHCLSWSFLVVNVDVTQIYDTVRSLVEYADTQQESGGRKVRIQSDGDGGDENSRPRAPITELLFFCFLLTSVLILLSLVLSLSFSSFLWSVMTQGLFGIRG